MALAPHLGAPRRSVRSAAPVDAKPCGGSWDELRTSTSWGPRAELALPEEELANLTSAVAAGGDVPSLLTAIRQREARRKHVAEEIAGRLVMTHDPDVTSDYSIVTGDADLT